MPRIRQFGRRWKLTIGYTILVIGVVVALVMSYENQQRVERDAVAAAEQAAFENRQDEYKSCQTSNDLKRVILTLTERISSSNEGGADFTRVPGFEDLDPALQQFLRNLSAPSDSEQPGDDRLVTIAREVLVADDCGEEPQRPD